jgi:hypothetical protein
MKTLVAPRRRPSSPRLRLAGMLVESAQPSASRFRVAGVMLKREQSAPASVSVDPMFARIHSAKAFELDSVHESFGAAFAKSRMNA